MAKSKKKEVEETKVTEVESKPDAPLYKYNLFTQFGAVAVVSEYSTRKELWEALVNCKSDSEGPDFFMVDAANNLVELSIRPSAVIMVNAPYGDAPIVMNEAQPQGRVVHQRRPSRVIINQPGGGPGAARMPIPQQRRKR